MNELPPDRDLPPELAATLQQLDALVDSFELHEDEEVRERALRLLQCVDRIHRGALRRIAHILHSAGLQHPALDDAHVRLLFELYDLQPGGERARVDAVLDVIRPLVESHGGRLEVTGARAGIVTVQLTGAPPALRGEIEQTLREGMTDFVRMELEVVDPPPTEPAGFVPLSSLLAPKK